MVSFWGERRADRLLPTFDEVNTYAKAQSFAGHFVQSPGLGLDFL
jgi:hypothetical protein